MPTSTTAEWEAQVSTLVSCNRVLQLPRLGGTRKGWVGSQDFPFHQPVRSLSSSAVPVENAWGAWIFILICQWWDSFLSSSLGWRQWRPNEQWRFWPSASSKLPTDDVGVSYVGKSMKRWTPPTQRCNMGTLPSGSQNSCPDSAVIVRVEKLDFHPQLEKLTMTPSLGNTVRES